MHAKMILDSCFVEYVLCITFKIKLIQIGRVDAEAGQHNAVN
jgi:hypothetical protein